MSSFSLELWLRRRLVGSLALGLFAVAAITGALYPAFGDSFGKVDLPAGVGGLIGGGDFGTITGWLNAEIASVYGPLVLAGVGITAATAATAGEEEQHVLALVLARPVPRTRVLLEKGAAVALAVAVLGVVTWVALVLAVVLAGGGIGAGKLGALALHLTCLGLAVATIALAAGAATGRRGLAAGGTAALTMAMYLVNGLAPAIHGLHFLRYASLFHYYEGRDPLATGVHLPGIAALLVVTAAASVVGVAAFRRRDLRG